MIKPNIEKVKQFVYDWLARELPPKLRYHSIAHTRDDVLPNAERLAALEGISDPEDWLLLRTAALYHDIGFVESHLEHEEIGMRIAAETLPQFGYSQDEIMRVQCLIQATRIPQMADQHLAMLLADADLDVLGREDFFSRNLDLYHETQSLGKKFTLQEWYRDQLIFIKSHRYLTRAAQITRLPGKISNIAQLEKWVDLSEAAQKDEALCSDRDPFENG